MSDGRRWSHAAWVAEMVRRFGPIPPAWAVVCPVCTTPATLGDFLNVAGDDSAGRWAQECIGRQPGAPAGLGCDFAAYGLIPAPWTVVYGANLVLEPGRPVRVFPFAEPSDLERHQPVGVVTA